MNIKYGKQRLEATLDEHGSTMAVETHFKDYNEVGHRVEYFEIRNRVASNLEEISQLMAFQKQYSADPTMLEPTIRIEGRNKGDKWYIVNCYKKIVN